MSIQFENPPVAEVAFSISFEATPPIYGPLLGLFWANVRDQFSLVVENAPLPVIIEPPVGSAVAAQSMQVEMLDMPPLRRTILSSADGKRLIQIQQDRFILNWKRAGQTTYSDYASAFKAFHELFASFEKTLLTEGNITLRHTQFELQYVNLIGPDNGLGVVDESQVLIDHARVSNNRFLPPPSGYNWVTSYPLPNNAGRLHTSAQAVVIPGGATRHIRLDIAARGYPVDPVGTTMNAWFDLAHDWITYGFADITSPVLHEKARIKK